MCCTISWPGVVTSLSLVVMLYLYVYCIYKEPNAASLEHLRKAQDLLAFPPMIHLQHTCYNKKKDCGEGKS